MLSIYSEAFRLRDSGLTIREISNILGVNDGTLTSWIYTNVKPYIVRKALGEKKIYHKSSEYDEVLELHKKGFRLIDICKILGIPYTTVRCWIKCKKVPRDKQKQLKKLKLGRNEDFHYIKGVIAGDGSVCLTKRGGYTQLNDVVDKDFAEYFHNTLERWSGLKASLSSHQRKHRKLGWHVVLCSVFVAEFLKESEPSINLEFLKGFYDSEGCIYYGKGNPRGWSRYVSISNSKLELLEKIKQFLEEQGVKSYLRLVVKKGQLGKINDRTFYHNKDCFTLFIFSNHGIRWFAENIGFRIQRKQAKLLESLKTMERNLK